ncbi:MAG: TolC family protein [Bacteroidales bacterium]
MTTTSKILLALLPLAIALTSRAQDTLESYSLKEARAYALEHNINVKNADLDVEKAKKQVWETTAIGLPQVNSSFSYNNNIDLATQLLPGEFFGQPGQFVEVQFGTQHNATANVSANQIIFSGPYIVGLQAARTFKNISAHQKVKTRIETKYAVTQAYYSILVARENIEFLKKTKSNMEDLLADITATWQEGLAEETDVDQIRINLLEINNQLSTLQRQADVGKSALKYQMGLPMSETIELRDSLTGILSAMNLEQAGGKTLKAEDHIDYKIVNTQERMRYLEMQREKTEYLPSISAFYSHQQNAMREEFNYFDGNDNKWFTSNVIGLQVEMPIFSSGSRLSKVQQAQIELEKTQNQKKQLQQSLQMNVQQARTSYMSALERYHTQKENLQLAQKVYQKSLTRFKEGMSSSSLLTQNHNQLLNNQTSYYQAIYELLNASNELNKALNEY